MSQQTIRDFEKQYVKADRPHFEIGDTVGVHVRIIEGDKQRIQVFTGTVIGRRGAGVNEKLTVRRIIAGEGVERVFPLHSPQVARIDVIRSGVTRRAKLYYLRDRVGKATRLKERRTKRGQVIVEGEETVAEREAREAADEAKIRAAEKARKEADRQEAERRAAEEEARKRAAAEKKAKDDKAEKTAKDDEPDKP